MINRKLTFLIIGFNFILGSIVFSQQQNQLDSLVSLYQSGQYNQSDKLSLLKEITDSYTDPENILYYANLLKIEARKQDSSNFLFNALVKQAYAFQLKSDWSKALENYFAAANIVRKGISTGTLYINIADVYSLMGKHNNAVQYYLLAIEILKKENDSLRVASALYNLGDEYLKEEILDSALFYTQESQSISNKIKYDIGEAYGLGNIGVIHMKRGDPVLAETILYKSIKLLEEINEYAAISEFLIAMSEINQKKNNMDAAIIYANKSLALATKYGLKNEISNANLKLSELHESLGNMPKSLSYYKNYITYRDSVNNLETVQKVADLRTNYEVSQKQKEVDLLATKNKLRLAERNGFVFASLLLASLLVISVYFYSQRVKRNKLLSAQKMQEAEILHQKNLMQSVITSQEAERKRIGMDLHDEVGAALSTLRMSIDRDAEKMQGTAPLSANYKIAIDKIITNMRHISHALSPRISGSYGFYDAVHELADSVNISDHLSMNIQFDESNLPKFSDEQTAMALYRVIAELVNNTLKHAHAKNIYLEVDVQENNMNLTYRDDGIGLHKKTSPSSNGMGMNNIESRLNLIHAKRQLNTPANGGYEIIINVPLN